MTDPLLAAPSHFLQPPAPPPAPPPRNPSRRSLLLRLPRRFKPIRFSAASTSIGINPIPPARWRQKAPVAATAWSGVDEGTPPEGQLDEDVPTSIELVPVASEEQFDRIIAEAQQLEESMIVLWMANWCRKCIYLKPKLEKLAAEYYPRIRFYCIDVNTVPQRLVNRAGITKMPTIQLWKDSHKQGEVIGGHKAWLVVDDIRRMIENEE